MDRQETERSKDDPSVEELIRHHWVTTSAAMVRQDALGDLRFDETTGHAEDMILFADLRLAGPWRLVDAPLLAKRVHQSQVTQSHWHRVWAVETRVKWLRHRHHALGPERAQQLEDEQWDRLIGFIEDLYWRRDTRELKALRDYVSPLCPERMSRSFLANRKIMPPWVYRVRDTVAKLKP